MKMHTFIFVLTYFVQLSDGFWLWRNKDKDKVDGKWSQWSNYSSCQLTTDNNRFPYRFRTRRCNNPAPKAGGEPCKGQNLRKAPCSDCDWPLGIENKVIKDSRITASTFHEEFPAKNARLNGPSAWCAKELTGEVFLQVDFQGLTLVTGIATQGYYPDAKELSLRLGSVSKYQITFSDNGIAFEVYENSQNNKIFIGNGNNLKTVRNTFEPQIAARYIRIHPVAFIKFVCMKVEFYGCRFKCGGYLPSSPGDLLADSSESEDLDCFWQAHLPNSSKINFDFINFNLPCKHGQVEIKGSYPFYGGSKSLGNFCHDKGLAPPSIESTGKKLWIRFQSKSADTQVGFYGRYFPNCDYLLNSSTSGLLSTPKYPKQYNHNSRCTWTIIVPVGQMIQLEFLDLDIEEDPDCNNDYLSVFDSNSSTIGQYCNSRKPPRFVCSSSNVMRLNFKTDDVLALKGFLATYRAMKAGSPCIPLLSSTITPSPSVSSSMMMMATANFTMPTSAPIIAPTSAILSPSIMRNNSIGGLLTGNGALSNGNRPVEEEEDDEDNGLTTIIIISVFSFIVLCMIIVSVIPSMIHGYEKRKREREWMAATDLAVKKTTAVENEYEMQPVKIHDKNKNADMEPNEGTAFLDPDNSSHACDDAPSFDVSHKEDTASASHSYNDLCSNKAENCTGDPFEEDLECELEYDMTDLNLSASYEDIGSSFATEMAALMHNYKSANPNKEAPSKLRQPVEPNTTKNGKNLVADNKESDKGDKVANKQHQDNESDKIKLPKDTDQSSDKLQTALTGLKATLSDVNSDSSSIPEIGQPETFSTNSTVSVTDSQDIASVPAVKTSPAVWEKNTMTATDNQSQVTARKTVGANSEDTPKGAECHSTADAVPETFV